MEARSRGVCGRLLRRRMQYRCHYFEFRQVNEDNLGSQYITYVRASLAADSAAILSTIMQDSGLANTVPPEKMHCTVLYSRTQIRELPSADGLFPLGIEPIRFELWEVPGHSPHLVLCLHSPELVVRHQALLESGGSHDFPGFNPHISICKNVPPGFDLTTMPPLPATLTLSHEDVQLRPLASK